MGVGQNFKKVLDQPACCICPYVRRALMAVNQNNVFHVYHVIRITINTCTLQNLLLGVIQDVQKDARRVDRA